MSLIDFGALLQGEDSYGGPLKLSRSNPSFDLTHWGMNLDENMENEEEGIMKDELVLSQAAGVLLQRGQEIQGVEAEAAVIDALIAEDFEYKLNKRNKRLQLFSLEQIESHFPVLVMTSDYDESVCSVCFEKFCQNQEVRQLYCGHVFHDNCIQDWILKGTSEGCCECRHPFFEKVHDDDEEMQ
jgi:hypothetical protein